ncbi:repeat domain (List_Bact_rpt) [Lachnospiraceae bacterium]|nr:repeat domain (List_Bact_rpt) [Lachnospiraceae bacterium]
MNRKARIAKFLAVMIAVSMAFPVTAGAEAMDSPNLPNTGESSEFDAPNIANGTAPTSEYDTPNIANTAQTAQYDSPTEKKVETKTNALDRPEVIIREKVKSKKLCTVSFCYNYGSERNQDKDIDEKIMPSKTVSEADYVLPYCEYSRDGYVFSGWSTSREGEDIYPYGDSLRLSSGQKNLYARWKERNKVGSFKVRFNANGGTGSMKALTANGGSINYPENEFTREGYAFLGWGVDAKTTVKDDSEHFFKDGSVGIYLNCETTTLYAIWQKTALKDGDKILANGYTKDMNKSLSYNRILRRIRFKDASGKEYTVSMNLRLAKAVKYNGTGHRYTKNNDESPIVDVDNSKIYINGTKVRIKSLVVKNGKNAWVSQNSVFGPLLSAENMETYSKVPLKKQPVYYLQLKPIEDSSKATKKAVRYLNKYFKKNPTTFEIVPIQLGKEKFKTATVASGGAKIKKLVGTTIKKGLKENKDGKKDYKLLSIENGVAKIQGTNNYNGTIKIKLK